MTTTDFRDAIVQMLLVRKGEVLTPELALERANNIAAAFGAAVELGEQVLEDAAADMEVLARTQTILNNMVRS